MLAREESGVFRHLCKGIVPHRDAAIREIFFLGGSAITFKGKSLCGVYWQGRKQLSGRLPVRQLGKIENIIVYVAGEAIAVYIQLGNG